MMMAAGAESPAAVATQSGKTDILRKMEHSSEDEDCENNHQGHQQSAAERLNQSQDDDQDINLSSKIDLLQLTLLKVKCDTEAEIRRLCQEVEQKNEILRQLRRQLEEQGDYKELQHQASFLKSPLAKSATATTTIAEEPKPSLIPDMLAFQQMKALQDTSPALKALVDVRAASMLPWLRPPNLLQSPPTNSSSASAEDLAKIWRRNLQQSLLAVANNNKQSVGVDPLSSFLNANKDVMSNVTTRSSTPNTSEACSPPPTLMPPPYQLCNPTISNLENRRPSFMPGNTGRIPKSDPMEGQLQDMLHYNMEKCAGQALDTHATSRRVRELLSSHNIGQRLFAKYVLGLSQGTVSELLSKPKMWEKLTEKGRDSYRKMHAWAYDEHAVLLLKSLIPRKGELMRSASSPRSLAQIQRDKARQMRSPLHQPPTPPSMIGTKDFYALHHERLMRTESSVHDQSRESESPQDLSKDAAASLLADKESYNEEDSKSECSPPSTPQPASVSNRPPPPLIPFSPKSTTSSCGSTPTNPLQQMVTITNSLTALPPPPLSSPTSPMSFRNNGSGRPGNKMPLPPISQEQFDKYSHINTELLVRKVKECLSQNSISQRLFGECVLGLSQGSVSDLLTRPKPWHMLTQKGKEPFIRMQMFADDPDAVKRLMASQYRVAPDRLMRSSAFSTPSFPYYPMGLGSPVRPPKTSPSQFLGSSMSRLFPEPLTDRVFQPFFHEFLLRPPQPHLHFGLNNSSSPLLSEELDTVAITSKVKEKLAAHNLGQKIFGEAVLGLSQGSVSEYLCKPKPWSMLSMKGKEPYIKMQLWLDDPLGVEKLRLWDNSSFESRKRRNSSTCPSPSESPPMSSSETKRAKIEVADATDNNKPQFDLFKLLYSQRAAATLSGSNPDLPESATSPGEKTPKRKSSTPQQYLSGSQTEPEDNEEVEDEN